MLSCFPTFFLASLAALVTPALSLALPPPISNTPINLSRRASSDRPVSVVRASSDNAPTFGFTHADDQVYIGTITVNGVSYQVLLDTGSADTWIDPLSIGGAAPPGVFDTGVNSSTIYVDGSSSTGPIVLADVTFGQFTIKNQAITLAYGAATGAVTPEFSNGVLGLAGASASSIYDMLKDTDWAENGTPIMYNLFAHEPSVASYSTWLPSRSEIGLQDGGVLTIGEVLANTTAILDAPRLEAIIPSEWTTVMDGMRVNGRWLSGHSNNSAEVAERYGVDIAEGGSVATFDTGTSFIRGPNWYVDQVYGDIPGAIRIVEDGEVMYGVPCDTKMNMSFSFGGIEYPIRPADVHRVVFIDEGQFVCLSSLIGGENFHRDWLIGDTFLRNVYSLWGYNDITDPLTKPYIQMLSIIDPAQSWLETDALFLLRLLAFEDDYQSTLAVPVPTPDPAALLRYTGSPASASLVAAPARTAHPSAPFPLSAAIPARPTRLAQSPASSDTSDNSLTSSSAEGPSRRTLYVAITALASALALTLLVLTVLALRLRRASENPRSRDKHEYGYGYRPLVPRIEFGSDESLSFEFSSSNFGGRRDSGDAEERMRLYATRYDAYSDGPSPASGLSSVHSGA